MVERFPGDEAAANGFGRRSLREQESWLLFQANIPALDMRAGPTGWRLSVGGVPIPPLPDTVAKPKYFAEEVEIVRASLTDAQLSLPQYAADNHGTGRRISSAASSSDWLPPTARRWSVA